MVKPNVLEEFEVKKADISAIADRLIHNNEEIRSVVEALQTEKSSKKYAYEKVLRLVSERMPDLVYPYFDIYNSLLDSDNSFLKWGAIMAIANLTVVDNEKKFEAIFQKYFTPIQGPTMVTAANIIGSSAIIAQAKPALKDAIAREILKVENAKYQLKGVLSPECRNVAIGHAIDTLGKIFDRLENKADVVGFVKRQLKNTRKPVAKKAAQFLQKNATDYTGCTNS